MTAHRVSLLRDRSGQQRVTNVELFYDLVLVFAVTQLSHFLLSGGDLLSGSSAGDHARTALRAALLLTMVWLYTTWVTRRPPRPDRPARRTGPAQRAGPSERARPCPS